ncbi:MAG: dihydroorotase [Candidatus Omnitrophica bacterium CG_4_9_14_0_2_um_filter_42_8]|nr:MAG: dihydroorotase [Candidatus Omnitrophica bacterium CG22_combo_CG10-13_8_21_14_all_43_16]PJC48205.1 MAG: dihydroorotase [Candidatus Omnitrophica bacterium CG_4_9_14_0_2_um_filter_42_8]
MKLLIKNGRVIDPANKIDDNLDILIEGGKISKTGKSVDAKAETVIDASGKIVMPGIIDMHVHLREPGREDKETVFSGTMAAAKGGVTSVLCMPNTLPSLDSAEIINTMKAIIKNTANVDVFICGAITIKRQGKELVNIGGLKKDGIIAISDDGASVDSDELMLKALKEAKKEKILVICHSEDKALSGKGLVNRGFTSTRLGLRGISKESEYKRVGRDIKLAEESGAAAHIAHVSCAESVEIIRKAKKKGIKVTAETAPHYFSLSEGDLLDYNTNMKINPPLRAKDDILAIKQGLKDGTIDIIASDHAPHTENEKEIEFEHAEFGTIGLETELAVSITELIGSGILTWQELIRKMSLNPAMVLGIDKGTLGVNKDADIAIVSPDKEWIVDKAGLVSKSKNSAFIGRKLKGAVECTIYRGKVVYKA